MDIGLFLPVATRGFLISTTTPKFEPTFDRLLKIVQRAEEGGLDFALSMVKLHGFGGPSGYWDACLDSFTLIAGLLARTSSIKLFASSPILAFPPAMCARAAVTMDSIAPGRFGVNIVTGWQKAEYDTMNMWPGEEHYSNRYDYAREYVSIMQDLWSTGTCDLDGNYFQMRGCEVLPKPSSKIEIVCAGQSQAGMEFAAKLGDYNFVGLRGINEPTSIAATSQQLSAVGDQVGRKVGCYALLMVCADETSEAARARWQHYCTGIDREALAWAFGQTSMDKVAMKAGSSASHLNRAAVEAASGGVPSDDQLSNAIAMSLGTLVGSYQEVAAMLDEIAATDGVAGIMVALANWETDVDTFCTSVEPAMKSRANRQRQAVTITA